MGLVSAWVLVTLTALVALGLAASAWRLARRVDQPPRDVVPLRQAVQRLAGDELPNDLPPKGHAA